MSNILIRNKGAGPWEEPAPSRFELEAHLQEILADHPQLIPGVGPAARTCKEFRSDVGRTDLVAVESDGSITLVECKLASNPQIRREIIGQMFDYASRFWKMNAVEFQTQWEARTGHPLVGAADQDIHFEEDLAKNLTAGRFSIVLAVDEISAGLKRMVEYLNFMAGPETSIIAVQYTRMSTGDIDILMHETYGEEIAEAKAEVAKRQQRTWTLREYQDWLEINDRQNLDKFNNLIAKADSRGMTFAGSPVGLKTIPSGGLRINNEQLGWIGTLYIYHYEGGRTSLEFSFTNQENKSVIQRMNPAVIEAFLYSLNQVPHFQKAAGILKDMRDSNFVKRPNIALSDLPDSAIDKVVVALDKLRTGPVVP
ncbi:PDDEXK family nuclease [Arthrobacter monumenti]